MKDLEDCLNLANNTTTPMKLIEATYTLYPIFVEINKDYPNKQGTEFNMIYNYLKKNYLGK